MRTVLRWSATKVPFEVRDQRLVDGCAIKVELLDIVSGSLAMVNWYLIEWACFSELSAESRSPTIRGGSCWRFMAVAMTSS